MIEERMKYDIEFELIVVGEAYPGPSINIGVDVGLYNGLNTTITRKFGISVGTGFGATTVQIGVGDSQTAKPILKLHE
jgi:threonine/homoserine/homoserine lactone efflux protein